MSLFDTYNLERRKSIAVTAHDPFEIEYDEKEYQLFTDDELVAAVGSTLAFDAECYVNYFLVSFKCARTKRIIYFEKDETTEINTAKLRWIMENFWIIGFNSRYYDLPLIYDCINGMTCSELKAASNAIIFTDYRINKDEWQKAYGFDVVKLYHIDLIEVAPLDGSLKIYAGRLHCPRLQELPLHHETVLEAKHKRAVKYYNINDLDMTILLLNELKPQLELRYQLSLDCGQDLLSKSDAQIAESVIVTELKRRQGWFPKRPVVPVGTSYQYIVPKYLDYHAPVFKQMLEVVKAAHFVVGESGSIDMPPEIGKLKFRLGRCTYKMGIGGLHTCEQTIAHHATETTWLIDKDVASYYPAIILNLELYPKHIGKAFLTVYRDIVNRRLQAKKVGNKVVADSLKITINGAFGKFGNRYAAWYSPDIMMQITVTGQLCLLMLIDLIEQSGIPVISANTDGVIIECPKDQYKLMEAAVIHWQNVTGFDTEETRYKSVYSRDVNNYVAVKEDGECKVKGVYAERGSGGNTILSKNPETLICNDALTAFLGKGIPIEKTINDCKDIRRFISLRNVKGGAIKSGVYLGRAVRWYYSTDVHGEINYVTTGNKVPKTDGAMPLMDLPSELPRDLDFDFYTRTTREMLNDIGYYPKEIKGGFFND